MQYINTSATERLGARPDQNGKNYFRIVLDSGADVVQAAAAVFGISLGFTAAAGAVYDKIQESNWVIPVTPRPVNDGSLAAVVDVAVNAPGASITVGELVDYIHSSFFLTQFSSVSVRSIARVSREDVSSSSGPAQRQAAIDDATRQQNLLSHLPALGDVSELLRAMAILLAVGAVVWVVWELR